MTENGGKNGPWVGRIPWKNVAFLVAALVGLYFVYPRLIDIFSEAPGLKRISWPWFVLMFLADTLSFACYWAMMRVTVAEPRWFVVATTQLTSNAFSRIVPGGAASGGTASYQMLVQAGAPRPRVITGLTATTLLSTAVLLALPVLGLPTIFGGPPVADSLIRILEVGAVLLLMLLGAGALLLFSDAPLAQIARGAQWARNRVLRRRTRSTDMPARLIEERDLIRGVIGDKWWQAIPAAAGNWLFDMLALYAALLAVGADPHISLVLIAYVVAAALGLIPLTPGGVGFVEVGLTATLGLTGIGAGDAALATLAYRLVSYWLPIPIGVVALGLYTRRFGRPQGANGNAPPPA